MSAFSELIPGRWSSHPKALAWQRRVFVFALLLPLALIVVFGVWAFVDCGGWQKVLHPTTASFAGELLWLKLTVVVASATGAAYLTLVLLHGLAMIGDNGEGDDLPFPAWVLVTILFSWTAPIAFWAFRTYCLPPGRFVVANILVNGLCVLPIAAILFWIAIHSAPKKRKTGRASSGKRILMALAIVSSLCALAAFSPHCPVRQIWGCAWGAFAALMWIVLFFVHLGEWRKKRAARQEGGDDPSRPPEWVERVRARLPAGIVLDGEVRRTSIPDSAGFDASPDPELLLLMDGKTPTVDQSHFFRRFRDAHDETWKKLYDENSSRIGSVGCDMLLTGVEGSGRTEILLAAALYGALVRGDNVLYVVATQEQASALKEKIDRRIAALSVGDYVVTEVLTHSVMGALRVRKPETPLPSVLFATPEQVEENFFGDSIDVDSAAVAGTHEMILSYGTVLVDDFCEYALNVRVHLSFLLDKWRLVLANGYVVPQFVVALAPVYRPEGVQELGRRLFGVTSFSVDEDIVVLRPRETEPYWFGTIRIGTDVDAGKAVTEILRSCLEEQLKVVYYSRGMSKREKDAIRKQLEVYDDPLRLLAHIDELSDRDAEADAVLHLSLTSGNAAAAMRLRTGDTQAVFLRIVSDAEVETMPVSERLIPLPDETALALRIHHLKSVLKFIPRKTPVDATVWSRFGISMTSGTLREGCRRNDEAVPARWFYDSWTERAYGPRIAPYLVLDDAVGISTNGQHLDSGVLPSSDETLWRVDLGAGAMRLLLAKPEDELVTRGSLVEWRDESGNALGESDLAHVERFECQTENNTFVLNELKSAEQDNSRHALVAVGKFSRGAGLDFVFPERSVAWNPAGEVPYRCEDPSKVGNVASFRLENGLNDGIQVSGAFMGVVNSFGRLFECPERSYDYRAYVSGLILAPTFSPREREETVERMGLLSKSEVSTNLETYSPLLTHAFAAALRHMFDGAAFYALTSVFWCEGGRNAAGKAVVWFVEPVDSGRSLFPLFRKMQNNPTFLRKFFLLVREYIEKSDSVAKMRSASHLAICGDAFSESDRKRALSVLDVLVAENEQVEKAETTKRRGTNPPVRRVTDSYSIEEREFDRVVVTALQNFETEIDVTKFAAEYGWDHDRICDLFFDVLWNNPQIFYVTKQAQCQWSHCGEIVTRFVITDIRYGIGKDEYSARKAEFDDAVSKALAVLDDGITDVEKAKSLHDYIVRVCEYDRVAADTNDGSPLARTAYSVLVRHLAVCEGYTMAYRYLLAKAGIRAEEVLSEKMCHCWNYVNIGESWYHVDVTWDDPIYAGKNPDEDPISHDFFLLSDSAIQAKKHYAWNVRGLPPAADSRFDGRSWA